MHNIDNKFGDFPNRMDQMRKILRIFSGPLALCIVLFMHTVCDADNINADLIRITDVTPRAFSVVWTTSEAAKCDLNVFLDAAGNTPYNEAEIISESSEHFPAENIGVMKVQVLDLNPNTTYFFQTKTTFKRDGTVSYYPESSPFIEVKTEATSFIVNNDILVQQIKPPNGRSESGTLLIASVDQASFPITGWAGEGFPNNLAAIGTDNFYDKDTHVNLELAGGEIINLVLLGGGVCFVETQDIIPEETGEIQVLEVVANLPDSTCKNLLLKFMPWLPILLLQ